MRIYGVEILNEGTGMSVDDIVNESQMTFVARHVTPWVPKSVSQIAGFDLTGQTIQDPEAVTQATSSLF